MISENDFPKKLEHYAKPSSKTVSYACAKCAAQDYNFAQI